MTEKNAFQKAKEAAALGESAPPSAEPGTALTVMPSRAEQEVTLAEREHYAITKIVEEAAVQQFILTQDLSALKPVHRVAFLQYEKNRLGVEGHCIELMEDKKGKVKPYYNDECAVQMKEKRGAKTAYSNYGTVEINGTTLAHVDCTMTKADGRTETRRAYLDITGQKGQDLGNLLMKIETKAHRRSVLKGFGLTTESPEEGDGRIVQLEDGEQPAPPSIKDVFGQAGTSLIGTVQPQTASNQPAAQETQETKGTPETEQAEDATVIEIEAGASSAAPSGEPGKPETSPGQPLISQQTSEPAQKESVNGAAGDAGKPEGGDKNSTKDKPTSKQGSASVQPSQTSQESSATSGSTPDQSPALQPEKPESSEETVTSTSQPSDTMESTSGSQSEDDDLDRIFSDLEDEHEEAEAFAAEEAEEVPDPEDARIVTGEEMQAIFDTAKANGWTDTKEVATVLKNHMQLELLGDVPKHTTLGEQKQALIWFAKNKPGSKWPPVGKAGE